MSKRFRDREIWHRPWYRELKLVDKSAWNFIVDFCDNVGVWIPDFPSAEHYIGGKPDWEGLPARCNGNILVLGNGKWWVKDFCLFQYGRLCEENRAYASYIRLLKSHGLWELYSESLIEGNKALIRPIYGSKEQEQEQAINSLNLNIRKDKEKLILGEFRNVHLSEAELAKFETEMGKRKTAACIERLSAYIESSGKRYKSHAGAIRTWVIADLDKRFPGAYTVSKDFSSAPAPTEEEARPPTDDELAEVEAMKRRALDTPQGKMLLGIIGGRS